MKTRSLVAVTSLLLWSSALHAAPVRVRLPEGHTRGFLVLRSLEGEAIAHGELRQKPVGGAIDSVLALHFKDGSVREEVATFTQKDVFRLEGYRLVQRGPSFPTLEISFDRKSGRFEDSPVRLHETTVADVAGLRGLGSLRERSQVRPRERPQL